MANNWRQSTWGEEMSLEYGKGLRGYKDAEGPYRVYGSNGPVGWTFEPLAPGPGVILGRKGAYRGVEYSQAPFFVIDTAYYVKPKTDLHMRWLYYAIKHYKLGEIDDGSPIPSTTRSAVYVRDLQVPPGEDQRAIAHILGSLDDKIELNQQMNRTLEKMAHAIFKSWFIDFDPVRAKVAGRDPGLPNEIAALFPESFEDAELGEIPKGWKAQSLDEIADFLNGLACQKYPAVDGESSLPVIKIRELRQGISNNTDRATPNTPAKYLVNDGDVLFSWSGSLLVDIWAGGQGLLNQHVFKVTSEKYPKWFFFYWITHHLKEFQRIAADKATTMGHIKRHHLTDAKVAVPPAVFMDVATDQIGPLFDSRLVNNIQSSKLSLLRDTLLPQLISGELPIQDAEQFIGGSSD